MPGRRNTLTKDLTLPSLQTAVTIIWTEIATKTEPDITKVNHTDNQTAVADLGDVATSVRRKNAARGSTQTKNVRRLRRNTRPDSVIEPRDDSTTASRTDSSNILLNVKIKRKTQTLMRYLRPLLQISALNSTLMTPNL